MNARWIAAAVAAVALLLVGFRAVSALNDVTFYACGHGGISKLSTVTPQPCPSGAFPMQWTGKAGPVVGPTPSPTVTTPTPSPTVSTPPPTTTPSPTGTACTEPLGSTCGPFSYAKIPMSNGYDTYVEDQNVGANSGTSETATVTDPGNWSTTNNDQPYGYTGVQSFDNIQQLTNDWNGSGWGGSGSSDTPLNQLSTLAVNYSETSPSGANSIYEFAPDIWSDNYNSDIMFWVDTSPTRCTDNGLNQGNIIGQATFGGQNWTVYRYGGAGSEIIFILDGTTSTDPVDTGTCAQQNSGTIDLKAGLDWLTTGGFIPGPEVLTQINTGWEVTSADHATFTVNSYSITAAP